MDKLQWLALKKEFKKYPRAFWMDVILLLNESSINGNIAFSARSVENDFNKIAQEAAGTIFYRTEDIPSYLNSLENRGHISKTETGTYHITPRGLSFIDDDGGNMAVAKRKQKENRKFNFEYFKMGWDTVISLLALLISIAALFISLQQ